MTATGTQGEPIKAKVVLIDPATMTVVWMNAAAAEDAPGLEPAGAPVEEAVPLAEVLGALDAIPDVAQTGVARHFEASLVSTYRGSMSVSASLDRLPDGMVLLVIENAWRPAHKDAAQRSAARGQKRR